ncbi:receptor-like protein EIX1 [Neltuma alba]|uniref:receptor-like protein EIX1 n=1 Tax=Neltuma alba TaxID=207710 RepID=UPI0010A363AF|nr:receptor-like protein EIX1 [Prosopis alba]
MSVSYLTFVKLLQPIIILTLLLQAELFIIGSCWRTGDANTSCLHKERRALLNMKNAFVDDSGRLSSWGSSPDCCHWSGVLCNPDTGHVEMLHLHGDFETKQPLRGEISSSLTELQKLNYLDLSFNDFNGSQIPKFLASLSKLRYLGLSDSSFGKEIPTELGKLSNLRILNHSDNSLVGNIPFHLANLLGLQELHLDWNHLVGNIPSQLGNLSSLKILSIGNNDALELDDKSLVNFEWLSNLQSLILLDLSSVFNLNYSSKLLPIIGKLPNLRELWLANYSLTDNNILSTPPSHLNFSTSLVTLVFDDNKLTSSLFPWLFNLSSNLADLSLQNNHFTGPIPVDFGKNMNSLVSVCLSDNELNGTISDIHFDNLTKLQDLELSNNLLTLKFSNHWIPPFQLRVLGLAHCKLGPGFPRWLRTQNNLQVLSIFDAEINDSIPKWFWRLIEGANVLQIESSNLTRAIPDWPLEFNVYDIPFASNQIKGAIPPFLLKIRSLDISQNQISKFVLPCDKQMSAIVENLAVLNLSSNNLLGQLPNCWDHFKSLRILDLSNNQLSGRVPNSIGSLTQLKMLVLRNNRFSGGLPSLENTNEMGMLDLEKKITC